MQFLSLNYLGRSRNGGPIACEMIDLLLLCIESTLIVVIFIYLIVKTMSNCITYCIPYILIYTVNMRRMKVIVEALARI